MTDTSDVAGTEPSEPSANPNLTNTPTPTGTDNTDISSDQTDPNDSVDLPTAFFHTEGDTLVGTALARGPWDPGASHGGPVAALMGREVERHDPDPDLATVRLTIELLRPVPIARLRLTAQTLRPGKKVRLIGVSIFDQHDTEVARATAVRVRKVPTDVGDDLPLPTDQVVAPEGLPNHRAINRFGIGIMDALEMRAAAGAFHDPGPSTYWFRVRKPLVDDEPITPLTRALIAADFGNGTSSILSMDTHLFINPDLTVHLHRLPDDEWVANQAVTLLEPGSGSYAEAALFDRRGRIGRAVQSLYVATR